MKLMLRALFNYNMGGKIRRLNMNVVFENIWPKGLNAWNQQSLRAIATCWLEWKLIKVAWVLIEVMNSEQPAMGYAFFCCIVSCDDMHGWVFVVYCPLM